MSLCGSRPVHRACKALTAGLSSCDRCGAADPLTRMSQKLDILRSTERVVSSGSTGSASGILWT
ncbi:MAG TPA: hypothetical protein VJU87_01365, partial [Gemmatimonadaceae bacterium]|nr:hypothetical protein [Gemmatimonadaceae bacterium]